MTRYSLLFIAMCLALSGFGQQDLSLTDAVRIALENNYDLKMVRHNQRMAEIRNNWGTAGRYPYINLSAESRSSINDNDTDDFIQNQYVGTAGVNWTLFDGFSVRISKQRLDELEELSKQNTGIMIEGTVQAVILAYYTVLLEKEKLEVYRGVMDLSEDLYKRAELKKDFGTAVTYEVLQAQNAFLTDKSSWLIQEVAVKNALRNLNYLLAVPENQSYKLVSDFSAIPVDYVLTDLKEQMLENNKSLKNQYINQNLLRNAVALAKSDYYPTLSFNGGVSGSRTGMDYDSRGISWNTAVNYYGNFTLSFNLYSGGNRKRASQIAEIEREVGLVEMEQMKHELSNQLSNLFEFYLVRKELLKVAAENLATAGLNLQISREKYESGAINSFNFRDVQNIYLNAALRELEAVYYFIDVHTSLLRMTGTIIQQYNF
ncbi:TolC family protein [Gaoshiqia sp. Z1-71]|uniref:TolC family protein n=1 Tax=Gaoshiqia hydrogeniformans TaxID=3290090 RepID=UPI003BF7D6CC